MSKQHLAKADLLALAGTYVFSVLDFSHKTPRRIKRENGDAISSYCALFAGIALLTTLVTDVVLIFSVLQNAETGELDFSGIGGVNLPLLITVTAVGIVVSAALFAIIKIREKRAN